MLASDLQVRSGLYRLLSSPVHTSDMTGQLDDRLSLLAIGLSLIVAWSTCLMLPRSLLSATFSNLIDGSYTVYSIFVFCTLTGRSLPLQTEFNAAFLPMLEMPFQCQHLKPTVGQPSQTPPDGRRNRPLSFPLYASPAPSNLEPPEVYPSPPFLPSFLSRNGPYPLNSFQASSVPSQVCF